MSVTIILLIIILASYIAMLIMRQKNKGKVKIYEALFFVIQGILWLLVAGNNWTDSNNINRVVYIVMILVSFITGIQELLKKE